MSFLQPWMLFAIPLIAIPIVIHLVNQRRFQTVPWGAMRFLLEANRMSSGYTRLRQWLILAMRTLAILALILVAARPLTSGLLALLSGDSAQRAIVILDRSPSMGDVLPGTNRSRLESAIDQLAATFETLGIQRIVQIDEASGKPEEFSSLNQWLRAVPRTTWSATSDISGLLEQSLTYEKNNPSSNTVVWIASDLRESDWRSRDGRWAALRDGFQSLPGNPRFSILDLSGNRSEDRSIRIENAQCVDNADTPTLSISFRIDRTQGTDSPNAPGEDQLSIPVEIAVEGARTSLDVTWNGNGTQVNDYRIPLPAQEKAQTDGVRGWGWVKIPGDANPHNDISYFVFEQPPLRRTLIVSENPELISAIELCASIAPQQALRCETERITPAQLASVPLDSVAFLVWHDRLPSGKSLELTDAFVKSGGQVLFLPPETPDDTSAFGFQWREWRSVGTPRAQTPVGSESESDSMARIAQWQNDSELLANTLNGAPLPLGNLGVRRICLFSGTATPLASLSDGQPLLAILEPGDRTASEGSVVVCSTTPSDRDSTLAGDGVVLYVAIQRMLAQGAKRVAGVRQGIAGVDRDWVAANSQWKAGDETAPSNQASMHAGVYETNTGLVALQRGASEEDGTLVEDSALNAAFGALKWARIGVGLRTSSLVQEIWRWFVLLMLGALLVEGLLCLPGIRRSAQGAIRSPQLAKQRS
ncbi:MAG: BatA domain-containing protein [Planctomycetota bacterium]